MELLYIGIVILVLGNIYTSFRVFKCFELEKIQKIFQGVIVWVVPVVGCIGIIVYIFAIENDDNNKPKKSSLVDKVNDTISPIDVSLGSD